MEFKKFCNYASKIEAEASQNTKTEYAADMLKNASGEDLAVATRFIRGNVFPEWDDSKVEVGPSTMYKVLADASGLEPDEVEDLVAEHGGVGDACEHIDFQKDQGQVKLSSMGSSSGLTLEEVYETLENLSQVSGSGSQETKVKTLSNVILDCETSDEAKYFSRIVLENMRIGVGFGLVRDAIAEAFFIDKEEVERALMVTNDTGVVAKTAKEEGVSGLQKLEIELGRPLAPMLAKDGDIEEVLSKISGEDGNVSVEKKFDGARLQIHRKPNGDVSLYTRKLLEVTDSLPDVVEIVNNDVDADSVIVDAEVVAYENEDDDEPLPFQEVMTRLRRKYDVDEKTEEVHLDIHAFDILYKDGEGLIEKSLSERREILEDTCSRTLAEQWSTDDLDKIAELEQQALASGDEGLMVKNPDSQYLPDDRGWNWVKVKPEAETLDCAVVGGEWGEGRREGWIGAFMLAVRDSETGDLRRIGKVGTGLTDEQFEELTERFEPLITSEDGMDIEFDPQIVFEVGYEEIQPSPEYESGYGLRFPRFIGVREDKDIDDIDTVDRVEHLAD